MYCQTSIITTVERVSVLSYSIWKNGVIMTLTAIATARFIAVTLIG